LVDRTPRMRRNPRRVSPRRPKPAKAAGEPMVSGPEPRPAGARQKPRRAKVEGRKRTVPAPAAEPETTAGPKRHHAAGRHDPDGNRNGRHGRWKVSLAWVGGLTGLSAQTALA
jgi:hypothetical protein